jgi:hypothetical protein
VTVNAAASTNAMSTNTIITRLAGDAATLTLGVATTLVAVVAFV